MFHRNLHAPTEENTRHTTARDFLAVGFRQRRLIITTFVAIFTAVILIALFLPKQYESQMKILVRHDRADSVVTAEREAPQQFRTEVSEEELQSEAELLRSKDLLSKVVTACELQKQDEDSFWSWLSSRIARADDGIPGAAADEKIARAVVALEKNLDIHPIKLTNLIGVTYKAADPHQAARVLNTFASLYL